MANSTPKYEQLYREGRGVCGPPFQEFVQFFDEFGQKGCRILDLGCGQGRDALMLARKGHSVFGVDISDTGISQMLEDARKEGLRVEGEVADIVTFTSSGEYDVVLLDRVLHMLSDDGDRITVLETASHHTKPGGFMLIADTQKNKATMLRFFENKQERWEKLLDDKGFLFLQKTLV